MASRQTPRSPLSATEIADAVRATLAWLERTGTKRNREGMARYAIVSEHVFGVSVVALRQRAKGLGRSHELAAALWKTGSHEARTLAVFVEEPTRVTPRQMDQWCRDFDNWALCDTACFDLFDRLPHAWDKVRQWSTRRDEFVKRAAFVVLAGKAVHDKRAEDAPFVESFELIETAATDSRNFVKKAVSWALRSIGKRNLTLNAAAAEVARRLAASTDVATRWIGKDALRELTSPAVRERLVARRRAS